METKRNTFNKRKIESLIAKGETDQVELKVNFDWENNQGKYIKTMVGLNNNKGGYLIFGIDGKSRRIKGIDGNQFDQFDPSYITRVINSNYGPTITHWEKSIVKIDSNDVGVIYVKKREGFPSVCKRDGKDCNEGVIYYRYSGETKGINYSDMLKLINELKESEATKQQKIKQEQIRKTIKLISTNSNGKIVPIKGGQIGTPINDCDYFVINNTYHWIVDDKTLEYVINNTNQRNYWINKKYEKQSYFKGLKKGFNLLYEDFNVLE